ncbi:uncharacterized protein LOC102804547 [Saccoglossus kowalevskii]|uniref:Mucin-2-like n=1 Tax=Saccoglossus kowalevskii TaxID=10224 RepID=A0ABM0M5U5_SACKO|nr:PREDICTED: mucin-2-like [Saccoglossus kowalevskii]
MAAANGTEDAMAETGGLDIDPEEIQERGKQLYKLIKKGKDFANNGKDNLRNLCCPCTPSVIFGSILAALGVTAVVGTITAVVIVTGQNGAGNSSMELSTPSLVPQSTTSNELYTSTDHSTNLPSSKGTTAEFPTSPVPTSLSPTSEHVQISTVGSTSQLSSTAGGPLTSSISSTILTTESISTDITMVSTSGTTNNLVQTSSTASDASNEPTTKNASPISTAEMISTLMTEQISTKLPPSQTTETEIPTEMTTITSNSPTTSRRHGSSHAATSPQPFTTFTPFRPATIPQTTTHSITTAKEYTTFTPFLPATVPPITTPFTTDNSCSPTCDGVCSLQNVLSCPCSGASCDYVPIGCFADTINRAIATLEGTDSRLDGAYRYRTNPIEKCAAVARDNGYGMFAIQNGGWCASSCTACQTYDIYGPSAACTGSGKGGSFANDVYIFVDP